MDRRERDLRKLARDHGRVVERRGKHFALVDPEGRRPAVIASVSPSDHRTRKNLLTQLRHAELDAFFQPHRRHS